MSGIEASTDALQTITLGDLRRANEQRQALWCPDPSQQFDLSFRAMELGGEVGEALNVAKKLVREAKGLRGSRATASDLGEELADVVICADLMAMSAGVDLAAAVVSKFDATSAKVGLPIVLRHAEKEAAGDAATLSTVRARLLAAEEARDAARSEAKDEAAEFIFGVLEDALGNPAYNPCDGTETWDGDVTGTIYRILNASGLRNEDTGELATARAEKAEQERDAAIARAEKAETDRDAMITALDRLLYPKPAAGTRVYTLPDGQRECLTAKQYNEACARHLLQTVGLQDLLAMTPRVGAEAARKPCDPADPCAFAQALASENRTLDGLLAEAKERTKDAEARAERMRAALLNILRTTSNGMSWEDKVFAIEEIASDALTEQDAE